MTNQCLTLVVGAGPSGAHLARRLAAQGMSVTIVSLSRAERPFLETLSARATQLLPPGVVADASICASNYSSWGSDTIAERAGILNVHGRDLFIERAGFDQRLRDAAVAAGAALIEGRVVEVNRDNDGWLVTLGDERAIRCRYLVDATGRSSGIARRLGARRERLDRQMGLPIRLVDADARLRHATVVSATRDGWWFVGPSTDGTCAIFFTEPDLPSYRVFLQPGGPACLWSESETLRELCSRVAGDGERPLLASSERLRPFAGDGWLAVGDAALSCDPLSAQGLLSALETSELAATTLLEGANMDSYRARLLVRFLDYVSQRAAVYAREQRWPLSPFWQRRSRDAFQLDSFQV